MHKQIVWLCIALVACGSDQSTAPRTVSCSTDAGSLTARQVTLRLGQAVEILSSAADAACIQIDVSANSRYVVGVLNVDSNVAVHASFLLTGSDAAHPGATASEVYATATPSAASSRPSLAGFTPDAEREGADLHARVLRADRQIVERRGNPRAALARRAAAMRARRAAAIAPGVGDTLTLRIRDIRVDVDCTRYDSVSARTVYVGPKAIILEDVNAPLAGMDSFYQQLGAEFDEIIYPMLEQNFGNPLAYDEHVGMNGKVLMLFSPVINNEFRGVAGFVSVCDFFPRSAPDPDDAAPASNEAAIFYAYVADPDNPARERRVSVDQWKPFVRGVLAHESKHITSYAEKLARGAAQLEEAWLEEATAQTASEIYQRTYSGQRWKGSGPFASTLGCEPPLAPLNHCTGDHPQVMLHHFAYLYDYLSSGGEESPVGDDRLAYYGGSWSFVRWAIDHYAPAEAAFLQAITQSTDKFGIANLEARTGQGFQSMVANWTLAAALPRYASARSADELLSMPSWDYRDIFAGMNRQLQGFLLQYPLTPLRTNSGAFSIPVSTVRGGGASIVEIAGGPARVRQLLQLESLDGTALPATSPLRMLIARVQ